MNIFFTLYLLFLYTLFFHLIACVCKTVSIILYWTQCIHTIISRVLNNIINCDASCYSSFNNISSMYLQKNSKRKIHLHTISMNQIWNSAVTFHINPVKEWTIIYTTFLFFEVFHGVIFENTIPWNKIKVLIWYTRYFKITFFVHELNSQECGGKGIILHANNGNRQKTVYMKIPVEAIRSNSWICIFLLYRAFAIVDVVLTIELVMGFWKHKCALLLIF